MSYLNYKNIIHILNFIFLVFIAYINSPPEDFFFASGDFEQVISLELFFENYSSFFTQNYPGTYNNIQTHIFWYLPLSFINYFYEVDFNNIAFYCNLIFFIGSYYSVFFAIKIINNNINSNLVFILSYTYIFNIVVYIAFWYTWAYTPYFSLYIFFPINFAIFYKFTFLKKLDKRWFVNFFIFFPIIFLNNIAFSNFAFYVVFVNFCIIFFLLCLIFRVSIENIFYIFIKAILFGSIFTLINLWSLLPSISSILGIAKSISNDTYFFSSTSWITSQSIPLHDLLSMGSLKQFKNLLTAKLYLFLIPLILIIILLKTNIDNFLKIILSLIVFNLFLLNKGLLILPEKVINDLFINTIFYAFRSSDKSLITIPFLITIFFTFAINNLNYKKKISISLIISLISIIIFYPIFFGKMKTSNDLLFKKDENYLSSSRSMIHKYPDSYLDMKNYIDFNKFTGNILALPYSQSPSMGWIYIDKYQIVSTDVTQSLINNNIFRFENIFLNNINLGYLWNNSKFNSKFYKNIFKLFDVDYILFHKDLSPNIVINGKIIAHKLINENIIKKKYENEDLIFYEIVDKSYTNNLFSIPTNLSFYNYDTSILNEILNSNIDLRNTSLVFNQEKKIKNEKIEKFLDQENFKKINYLEKSRIYSDGIIVDYSKTNKNQYIVEISTTPKSNSKIFLTFLRQYDSNWEIECLNAICQFEQFRVNGYANGWEIKYEDSNLDNIEIKISFMKNNIKNILYIIYFIFTSIFFFSIFYKFRK